MTRRTLSISSAILALLASAAVPGTVRAGDGTWTTDGDGNWSDTTKWSGGTVADGADFTANFTNDISAAPTTVTLDTARTIGNIEFSDNGVNGASWTISGANTLTLAVSSGTPEIRPITASKIDSVIDGTQGLTLRGGGTIRFDGANTYSGVTTVGAGAAYLTLYFTANVSNGGASQLGNSTTTIEVNSGAIISNGNASFGRNVNVSAGGLGTPYFRLLGSGATWSGSIALGRSVTFDANPFFGTNSTLSGQLTGTGTIDFVNGGGSNPSILTVSNNNSNTGATTIGSLLEVRMNGTNSNQGNYTVFGGGTLGGSGTIGLAATKSITISSGGKISPGNSIGTLTVTGGNVTLSGTAALISEIGAGNSADLLTISGGALDLGSASDALRITGTASGEYLLAYASGGVTGVFNSVFYNDVLVPNPTQFESIGDTHYLKYTSDSVLLLTPEPASLALLMLGASALLRRRAKHR